MDKKGNTCKGVPDEWLDEINPNRQKPNLVSPKSGRTLSLGFKILALLLTAGCFFVIFKAVANVGLGGSIMFVVVAVFTLGLWFQWMERDQASKREKVGCLIVWIIAVIAAIIIAAFPQLTQDNTSTTESEGNVEIIQSN